MVTFVTIYGNRCMGGRERSSGEHVIGVVFDDESHGNLRFCSLGRRYTVLKQKGMHAVPPGPYLNIRGCVSTSFSGGDAQHLQGDNINKPGAGFFRFSYS